MTTYILPGMGADATMYGPAFREIPNVQYVDWPAYGGESTISELASTMIDQRGIGEHDVVGGSSLGGIVASEIASQLDIAKLILIGSTLTPDHINPVLKQLSALSDITPLDLIKSWVGKASSHHENRLLKMFAGADTSFVRAMSKAVFAWSGNPEPRCDVAHIHGAKDQVIQPPPTGALVLADGGHMIAMTHEVMVAEFVRLQSRG